MYKSMIQKGYFRYIVLYTLLHIQHTHTMAYVQFSSISWSIGPSRVHDRRLSRNPLPVFSAGGPCDQFLHGQECPLFAVVHPAFRLPSTLKDGFEEAVVACHTPKPCKLPSIDSRQKRSCGRTRKLILLRIQHLGFCFKYEVRRSFLMHLTAKAWILFFFFKVSKQVHVSQS